jgi:hypothetical protein
MTQQTSSEQHACSILNSSLNYSISIQPNVITNSCNEASCAMTQHIATTRTRTINILCLCSSIVCDEKQEPKRGGRNIKLIPSSNESPYMLITFSLIKPAN